MGNRGLRLWAAASVAVLIPAAASAQWTLAKVAAADLAALPNVTVVYYDVPGKTEILIRRALQEGQRDSSGVRYAGLTESEVSYKYQTQTEPNGVCRVTGAQVDYRIKVTLPRLAETKGIRPAVLARWQGFYESLVLHEKGHVFLNLEKYDRLQAIIMKASCDGVDTAVNAEMEALEKVQAEFDLLSDHGAKQWVMF